MNHFVERSKNSTGQTCNNEVKKVNSGSSLHQLQSLADSSEQVNSIAQLKSKANVNQTIQRQENKTGLPDQLKSGIENLSGYSMNDVKVHYNSSKPAQLNAHAYAQGTDIHLASGQEKHLPHEAWHVVQQKQGRVKPTMQMKDKVNINDDSGLEKEADVMGAKALNISEKDPLQRKHINTGAVDGVVQRAIGLEIESSPDWQAYDLDYTPITGEHSVLYHDSRFRLETELSGKLEFVIEPPLKTTDELIAVMKDVVAVAESIGTAKVSSNQEVRDDFASNHFKEDRFKKVGLFLLSDVVKGAANVYISKGPGEFSGGFQATVGVHLSAVPYLMNEINHDALNDNYPSKREIGGALETADQARKDMVSLPFAPYTGISPEMEGLLSLIYYYIYVGEADAKRPFPKGITQVMAKTNFGKMFSMTPEATMFKHYPEYWVKYVTKAAGVNPKRKIFCGTFGDTEDVNEQVNIKIGDWLHQMTQGGDLLTVKGGGPEILKTMGETSKTDDLGAEGENNEGVIVELRGLDSSTVPLSGWIDYAVNISRKVEELHAPNRDKIGSMTDVMRERNSFFHSGLTKDLRDADDAVLKMSMEAYKAPFASQVAGLVKRAKEATKMARAVSGLDELDS